MHHKIAHHRIKRAGLEREVLRIGFLERDTGILAASDSHHLGGKVHARDDCPSLGERMGNVTWTRANLQNMAAATDVSSLQEQGDRVARHACKGVEITLCTTAPGVVFEFGDDFRIHRFAHGCPPFMAVACDHALFSRRTGVSTSIDTARVSPYRYISGQGRPARRLSAASSRWWCGQPAPPGNPPSVPWPSVRFGGPPCLYPAESPIYKAALAAVLVRFARSSFAPFVCYVGLAVVLA